MLKVLSKAAWAACCLAATAPAALALQLPRWELVETLRIAAEDGPAAFSDVRGIAISRSGAILVLDGREQELRIFDRNGRHIGTPLRRGRGPAEILGATGIVMRADGTYLVNDPALARIAILDSNGGFVRHQMIQQGSRLSAWDAHVLQSGHVVEPLLVHVSRDNLGRPTREYRARRISVDWAIDTVDLHACASNSSPSLWFAGGSPGNSVLIQVPFVPVPQISFSRSGHVWCTRRDEYRLLRLPLGRPDTLSQVEGTSRRVPVRQTERDSAVAWLRRVTSRFHAVDIDLKRIPAMKQAIDWISVDDMNRLWVARTTSVGTTDLDVYDESGRAIATAAAPFRITVGNGSPLRAVIKEGDFYAAVIDEDGVPLVVRARIQQHQPRR